jgi:hypothetical protein
MKSTAGAGVGSLLVEEATVLNPASMAFFSVGSFYFQRIGNSISPAESSPLDPPDQQTIGAIITDTKGQAKGSASFLKQKEGFEHRRRIAVSMAGPVGKVSSMGVTFRNTEDLESSDGVNYTKSKYNQVVVGITHALNRDFTIGMIVIDPMKKRAEDNKVIIGTQYNYKDMVTLMLDGGSNYNDDLTLNSLYKAAIQIKLIKDIYGRFGVFDDKGKGERGNGAGVSWVQPRLMIDFAFKTTKVSENLIKETVAAQIKETSVSLSYRF